MKLRLSKALVSALYAAAAGAALVLAPQTASAAYVIDSETLTCTISGEQEYVDAMAGGSVAKFTLSEGAVFTATGDNFGAGNDTTSARALEMGEGSKLVSNANSDVNYHRQISDVTLNGDATIEVNGNIGMVGGSYAANTLTLNKHTLYLTRSETATDGNEFRLYNTTVSSGTINIGTGVKMTVSGDATYGSSFTLAGTGTFDIGTRKTIGSITLSVSWAGTIRISNTTFEGTNLNALSCAGSVVELSGITGGYLSQWNTGDGTPTEANIRLVNGADNAAAWVYSNGSSTVETWNVFTGSWSGDGTFKKTGGYMESFRWKGDISAWTGAFVTDSTLATKLEIVNNTSIKASYTNAGSAAMSLTIGASNIASGQEVSVSGNIANTGDGTTTLTAFANNSTVTFSGIVSGLTTITLDGRAANSGNTLRLGKLVTAAGGTTLSTSYHGGTFRIGALSGSGALTLQMNAASTVQARLYIDGVGEDGFSGDIILDKENHSADGRNGVVVLNHATVAQNSVFRVESTAQTATLALGVNVGTAKLAGIHDGTMAANHLTIYSGAESKGGTTNNLELTGSGNYSSAASLQNVNLIMSGNGTQTFSGDLSEFTGLVKANTGTLLLANGSADKTLRGIFINSGTLELSGGQYTVGSTAQDDGLFADTAHVLGGSLVLSNGASLTVNAKNWWRFQLNSGENAGVYIKGAPAGGTASVLTATLQDGGVVTFKVLGEAQDAVAHLVTNRGNGNSFAVDQNYITIEGADYSVNYGAADKTVANVMKDTALTNAGTGTLTVSNAANTLVDLYAESGNIALSASQSVSGSAMAASGKSIAVNNGSTLTLKAGESAAVTIASADRASAATLTGVTASAAGIGMSLGQRSADSGAAATISNAKITIADLGSQTAFTLSDFNLAGSRVTSDQKLAVSNVTLDANSSITALVGSGSELTGDNVLTLNANAAGIADVVVTSSQLAGMTLTGDTASLTLNVGNFGSGTTVPDFFTIELTDFAWDELAQTLQGAAYEGPKDINTVFYVKAQEDADAIYSVMDVVQGVSNGQGGYATGVTLKVHRVPEPASGTLSLLSLAGLCARRRRK